jgi:hypothetical protein
LPKKKQKQEPKKEEKPKHEEKKSSYEEKKNSQEEKKKDEKKSTQKIDATLMYHFGNVVEPIDSQNGLIIHSVDNSGNWSTRGAMGQISKKYGPSVEKEYIKCAKNKANNEVGDIQTVNVSTTNNLFVCTLIAQKASRKGGAPPIEYTGLKYGLKLAAKFAQKNKLTIHFPKYHPSTPNLDWKKVEDHIKESLKEYNVSCVIYTRDDEDKKSCGKKIQLGENSKPNSQPKDEDSDDSDDPFNMKLLQQGDSQKSQDEKAIELISEDPMYTEDDQDTKDSKIFENVFVVISGYSDEETKEIKKLIENSGGNIQSKWSLKGDKSTHLICETFTTVFDHVQKLGGKIVNRKWIDESLKANKKQKEINYFYPQPETNIQKPKTNSPVKKAPPPQLSDIFPEKYLIYLNPELKNFREVKRYIFAFGGVVVNKLDESVTHLISDVKIEVPSSFSGKILNSKWILESVKEGELKSEKNYQI